MQNIKNFTLREPTRAELLKYDNPNGNVGFLISEDGRDWRDCRKLFADDTVKIMYDSCGVIRAVVDKPVPERGNTYAVSLFFPVNKSVAEIAVADYPAGAKPDGTWKFDGEKVYQDRAVIDSNTLENNTRNRDRYMRIATQMITAIQCSAVVGNPRDGDAENLLALQQYVDELRDVDVQVENPMWPSLAYNFS
ncbi:tail fiber assembly protein [Klebsiella aerogenes]|uniref:tail fiber assembly protein n=1 Tax=Klebsiella aerogenes TaxID=548 RepID=UPI00223509C6